MTTQIQCAILDIDGTLIDSNDAHAHSWVQAFEAYGYHANFAQVRPLIGMGGDKVLPQIAHLQKDSEQGKLISKRRKAIFHDRYLPNLRPFPHAWELLQHMHSHGLTLAIATSAEPDELSAMLKIIHPQAQDLFAKETSAKDAKKSKPDPDAIHNALQKLQAQPEKTIMLGDTAYDIEAADQAGVKTIAFRCGGWSDHDLQHAIAIYDGPADLLAHYQDSPLA